MSEFPIASPLSYFKAASKDEEYISLFAEKANLLTEFFFFDTRFIARLLYYFICLTGPIVTPGEESLRLFPFIVKGGKISFPGWLHRYVYLFYLNYPLEHPFNNKQIKRGISIAREILKIYWLSNWKYPTVQHYLSDLSPIAMRKLVPGEDSSLFYRVIAVISTVNLAFDCSRKEDSVFKAEVAQQERAVEYFCVLCSENCASATVTECGHVFCWQCIMEWLQTAEKCPTCRDVVNPKKCFSLNLFSNVGQVFAGDYI